MNYSYIFPLLILAVCYFLIIRPQQKAEKARQKFHSGLQPGMQIVTTSGICGRIEEINGPFVSLLIDKGVRLQIVKTSIQGLVTA